MTWKPQDAIPRRMGRPPLDVKPIKIRLTSLQRKRIDAVAGPNRIAAFAREAIDERLDRLEAEKTPDTT